MKPVSGQKKKKRRKRKVPKIFDKSTLWLRFFAKACAEVLILHRDSEDQSEGGIYNGGTPKYPCSCKNLPGS